jgi:4'-phosphopantetheinyl transferase
MISSLWPTPPAEFSLASDQVHVWCLDLLQSEATVAQLYKLLSADEQQRAQRFRFSKDQQAFIVARGGLRILLSRYLQCPAAELRFTYNAYGKPAIAHPATALEFNVSHSRGLALYVITRDRTVGIDVEYIRADFPLMEIAKSYFSAAEQAELRSLPTSLQPEGFFNAWTRKEAYIKAIGQGLSMPLAEFDVSLTPGKPAKFLAVRVPGQAASDWSLRHLAPAPGYLGAIAVAGHDWQLQCWHLRHLKLGCC